MNPLLLPIRFYRTCIAPLIGCNCRFTPSCSHYAEEAFSRHGLLRGGMLAAWRILRCNPFGGQGLDPVP